MTNKDYAFSVTWRVSGPAEPLCTARGDSEEEIGNRLVSLTEVVQQYQKGLRVRSEAKIAAVPTAQEEDQTAPDELPQDVRPQERYREITVKFSKPCASCGAVINVGEQARYDTQTKKLYCTPTHKLPEK